MLAFDIQKKEYDWPMQETITQRQAQLFRALMHPTRLAILALLRDGEACVCHIEAHLGYRQAYISQQLAALRTAGLVRDRREGWNIYYQVVQPELFALLDAAQALIGPRPEPTPEPRRPAGCACPKCAPGLHPATCSPLEKPRTRLR